MLLRSQKTQLISKFFFSFFVRNSVHYSFVAIIGVFLKFRDVFLAILVVLGIFFLLLFLFQFQGSLFLNFGHGFEGSCRPPLNFSGKQAQKHSFSLLIYIRPIDLMISEPSQCEAVTEIKPSHALIVKHVEIISNRLNFFGNRLHFHFVIRYHSLIVRIFGNSGNQKVTVMRSRYNFILMETDGSHTSFMSFYLNLAASAQLYKIQDIDNAIIGADRKLIPIMTNIITIHILPMLCPNINPAFPNIPQAQHLGAGVDKFFRIFGKSYRFGCILSPDHLLDHHPMFCVVEKYIIVTVMNVEVFTAL